LIPLTWLLAVTFTAGAEKIFHADPRVGFLAQARVQARNIEAARAAMTAADAETAEKAAKDLATAERLYANQIIDAGVAGAFLILVAIIVGLSVREWTLLCSRRKAAILHETPAVWLPEYALKESGPNLRTAAGAAAVALGLAKELSGETHFERARQQASACANEQQPDRRIFAQVTKEKFNGVRRCC
jgi:carbon starvation protein